MEVVRQSLIHCNENKNNTIESLHALTLMIHKNMEKLSLELVV